MARGLLAHRTLSEVGQLLGISPQRVGQIEKQALAKLARRPEIVRLAKEYGLGS
jgi:DNA-directed RNA polymerase sigma subunit (sigma70/sigma32)